MFSTADSHYILDFPYFCKANEFIAQKIKLNE